MDGKFLIEPMDIIRTFGGYFLALFIVRVMGKRSIGELGPFDFVLMSGIGDIMAFTILEHKIPFIHGTTILATLAVLEIGLSKITLKSQKVAKIVEGQPTILIQDGKLIRENLQKEKISYEDINKELRSYGIDDESIVERGTIEACGKFTIILKEEEEPITRKDLKIHKEGSTSQYIDERFSQVRSEINMLNTTLNNLIIEVRKINKQE